jgi:hypothetical protein
MKMRPKRKVNAGLVAGAAQALGVWWYNTHYPVPIPGEVVAAVMPVLTYIVSWLVPDRIEEE